MTYYIRVRGRVQGPFDDEKLRALIRRGQFSRMHEVSTDGQAWSSATDYPELFAKAANANTSASTHEQSEYAIQPAAPSSLNKPSLSLGPAPTVNDGWYFAMGDKQQGPVDFATLSQLFSSGQLNAESQVWRDGMANWTSARNVDLLASLLPQSRIAPDRQPAAVRTQDGQIPLSVATAAASAKGWLVFIFLSGYVASVLSFVGSIIVLIAGSKVNNSIFVAQGLSGMICAGAILVGAILLSHYSSAISRFTVQSREKDLCDLFFSLSRIWTYFGVALALTYALFIISVLLVVAAIPGAFTLPESGSPNTAMQDVLTQTADEIKNASSFKELYDSTLAIDDSECPPDFREAFADYTDAISRMIDVENRQSENEKLDEIMIESMIRGAMGDPLGKSQELLRDQANAEESLAGYERSYRQLLVIAKSHGVNPAIASR